MKIHKLKLQKQYWDSINEGTKTCEVRLNDRDFQKGDFIEFEEVPGEVLYVCGFEVSTMPSPYMFEITHIQHHPDFLVKGYCVLSIKKGGKIKFNKS